MGLLSLLRSKRDPTGTPPPHAGGFSGALVVDEHFVPEDGTSLETYLERNDLTAIHHLIRYRWGQAVLEGRPATRRILDLGCGAGYGAASLARTIPAATVVGIDYDGAAVALASTRYSLPNLSFRAGNPLEWPESLGNDVWDVIVCFDVIEHVSHRELLLEGVVEHLAKDGLMLFSTPSANQRNLLSPGWVHHKIEYCASSLFDFLRRYFSEVIGRDRPGFPAGDVFSVLEAHGVEYDPRINPVVCRGPIRLENPYR